MLTFATDKHGSYEYTGLDGTERGHGSAPHTGEVPAVGNNDASNSGTDQQKSSSYNYDLSNDVTSSSDAKTGGNTYDMPKGSSPDAKNHVVSDVKAGEKPVQATTPTLDPHIVSLLDLIQKILNELRQKVLGGSVHKRHARDLGN